MRKNLLSLVVGISLINYGCVSNNKENILKNELEILEEFNKREILEESRLDPYELQKFIEKNREKISLIKTKGKVDYLSDVAKYPHSEFGDLHVLFFGVGGNNFFIFSSDQRELNSSRGELEKKFFEDVTIRGVSLGEKIIYEGVIISNPIYPLWMNTESITDRKSTINDISNYKTKKKIEFIKKVVNYGKKLF